MKSAMKPQDQFRENATLDKLATPKPPLYERVLRKLYVVAVFIVVILLWTGL